MGLSYYQERPFFWFKFNFQLKNGIGIVHMNIWFFISQNKIFWLGEGEDHLDQHSKLINII